MGFSFDYDGLNNGSYDVYEDFFDNDDIFDSEDVDSFDEYGDMGKYY